MIINIKCDNIHQRNRSILAHCKKSVNVFASIIKYKNNLLENLHYSEYQVFPTTSYLTCQIQIIKLKSPECMRSFALQVS